MQFDWLKCRSTQLQFNIYWALGTKNFADFFTKNHSAAHHIALQPIYLAPTSTDKQLSMQGCIKILQSRLTKPVTTHPHTKLSPVPVTVIPVPSKPVSYKQLIKTVKQSRPDRISKPIVQVPQRPPASPTVTFFHSNHRNHSHGSTYRYNHIHRYKLITSNGYKHQYIVTISNCKLPYDVAHIMRVFTLIK